MPRVPIFSMRTARSHWLERILDLKRRPAQEARSPGGPLTCRYIRGQVGRSTTAGRSGLLCDDITFEAWRRVTRSRCGVVTATTKTGRQREPNHFDAAYAKVRFFEVMSKRNRGVSVRALTGDSATPIGDMDRVVCPIPDEGGAQPRGAAIGLPASTFPKCLAPCGTRSPAGG